MNLISICTISITLLSLIPLIFCKPKENFRGEHPNTLRQRRRRRKEQKLKENTPPTPTPPATQKPATPETKSEKAEKKEKEEKSVEPTQSDPDPEPKSLIKKSKEFSGKNKQKMQGSRESGRKLKSREPVTAKEKSMMKTTQKKNGPRSEYMEDQNEDETMIGVKSIE
ncbi:hypothetical protein B9Z55_008654 [Caenorhabditis nigoni]|uniref:Uncharacterized protein n=1 Tax=Caenorhabditis nigoni TaxID=1611254 RepID=A0A2G5UNP3_9PELO|nr:hypothetical protein B9Z55_008654 [Caenorhabditis nigoni]